ncbi:hypothetical protein FBU31_004405, partial [Coemansia sp. 'formosensis']
MLLQQSGYRVLARTLKDPSVYLSSPRHISVSAIVNNKHWDGAVDTFRAASNELARNKSAYQSFASLRDSHKLVLAQMQDLSDVIDLAVEQDDSALKQHLITGDIEAICSLARELYLSRLLHSNENADAAITITAGAG